MTTTRTTIPTILQLIIPIILILTLQHITTLTPIILTMHESLQMNEYLYALNSS